MPGPVATVILSLVVAEVLGVAEGVGLRVGKWGEAVARPPMAIVAMPEQIVYDPLGGRRSLDRIPELDLIVMGGEPTSARVMRQVAEYADSAGPRSIPAAIDAHAWISCDSARVASAECDVVTYASTDQLAFIFHIDITGRVA